MKKEEGFPYKIRCGNCGKGIKVVMIPMGDIVEEFVGNYKEKCSVCGCCDEWKGVEAI